MVGSERFILRDSALGHGGVIIIRQLLASMMRMSGQRVVDSDQSAVVAEQSSPTRQIRSMARLDRASSDHDVKLWHQQVAKLLGRNDFYLVCEPMCDGFAVSMTYKNGVLDKAVASDGDLVGQVITDTIRKAPGVPRRLTGTELPSQIEVMGNLYTPVPDGAKRAAGGRSPLRLFVHGISYSVGGRVPANQWSALAYLRAVGFHVSGDIKLARTPQEVLGHHQTLAGNASGRDYPCRGMLVKVNRFDHQTLLASREDGANWALAYAFPTAVSGEPLADHHGGPRSMPAQPQPVRRQPLRGRTVAVEVRSDQHSVQQVEKKVQELGGQIVRGVKGRADYIITDNAEKSMLKARLMQARTVGLREFLLYSNSLQAMSRLEAIIARI